VSRADLWAFASMVAVEFSIEANNRVCAKPVMDGTTLWSQCHPRLGELDCEVQMPRPFTFTHGRRDCTPEGTWDAPYKTSKVEVHPDPTANGEAALSYMKSTFGFNSREVVAIMGAHTLGRVHNTISLFQYTWKTRSGRLFNSGYYRNLVQKRDWYYPTGTQSNGTDVRSTCVGFGNAAGERPMAKWVPTAFLHLTNGGPVQWLNYKKVSCDAYSHKPASVNSSCEEWHFVLGEDEIMLNSDMGMYRNFSTESGGFVTGCPGLRNFNLDATKKDWRFTSPKVPPSDPVGEQWDVGKCPVNDFADPSGSTPMHQIVEEYADSNEKFLADFVPTFEKMLRNGYAAHELESAPMASFECPAQAPYAATRFYRCVPPNTPSPPPASPMPPPLPCESWCSHDWAAELPWSEKCGWVHCSSCEECDSQPPSLPAVDCHSWCYNGWAADISWDEKCAWERDCNQCAECFPAAPKAAVPKAAPKAAPMAAPAAAPKAAPAAAPKAATPEAGLGSAASPNFLFACFARESRACLVNDADADAAAAARACFGDEPSGEAALVSMATLSSGDWVLTIDETGAPRATRVLANQHREARREARLVSLQLRGGKSAVEMTPDHVLMVREADGDAQYAAARYVRAGSLLLGVDGAEVRVERVQSSTGRIINPVTASGTILVAADGAPTAVLAATHPEWISELLVTSAYSPMSFSLFSHASLAMPTLTQGFYTSIEPLLDQITPTVTWLADVPPAVQVAGFVAADVSMCFGLACFVAVSFVKPLGVTLLLALIARRVLSRSAC